MCVKQWNIQLGDMKAPAIITSIQTTVRWRTLKCAASWLGKFCRLSLRILARVWDLIAYLRLYMVSNSYDKAWTQSFSERTAQRIDVCFCTRCGFIWHKRDKTLIRNALNLKRQVVLITMMVDELDEANSSKIEIEHHQIWARAMIRASKIGNSESVSYTHLTLPTKA